MLQLSRLLRSKTRWFMVGGVIGCKKFVRDVVNGLRGGYLSEERKGNGSKVPDYKGELWSMRQLERSWRVRISLEVRFWYNPNLNTSRH